MLISQAANDPSPRLPEAGALGALVEATDPAMDGLDGHDRKKRCKAQVLDTLIFRFRYSLTLYHIILCYNDITLHPIYIYIQMCIIFYSCIYIYILFMDLSDMAVATTVLSILGAPPLGISRKFMHKSHQRYIQLPDISQLFTSERSHITELLKCCQQHPPSPILPWLVQTTNTEVVY